MFKTCDAMRECIGYDGETGSFWWLKPSHGNRQPRAINQQPPGKYGAITVRGTTIVKHRVAWFLHYGIWPDRQIDHINGDPSDNRIVNLRLATQQQNHYNRGPTPRSSSRYKGVTFHRKCNKWQAQIRKDDKCHYLGLFSSENDAAAAYNNAALEMFGEFARINVIHGATI